MNRQKYSVEDKCCVFFIFHYNIYMKHLHSDNITKKSNIIYNVQRFCENEINLDVIVSNLHKWINPETTSLPNFSFLSFYTFLENIFTDVYYDYLYQNRFYPTLLNNILYIEFCKIHLLLWIEFQFLQRFPWLNSLDTAYHSYMNNYLDIWRTKRYDSITRLSLIFNFFEKNSFLYEDEKIVCENIFNEYKHKIYVSIYA